MDPAIEVRGLTKAFGRQLAVDDLSFEVQAGRVTGFLGRNGAGKTTTMRMIVGLARPTGGSTRVLGAPHAVPAIVGAVAWIVIFENAALGFLGDAGRLLPGQAGHAVALVSRSEALLSPLAGGLLLAGYAIAVALAGMAIFRRRDVIAA